MNEFILYLRTRRRIERRARGIIHVGANVGQEAERYARSGQRVVWIEPNPSLIPRLRANAEKHRGQSVIEALVSERDGDEVDFHIAGNDGHSSSIFHMKEHRVMFPEVDYVDELRLTTRTLPAVLAEHGIDAVAYDTLVLDTQGAELMVLRGAEAMLGHIRYIQTEAPDFEAYEGCPTRETLVAYLAERGFRLYGVKCFARHAGTGRYFDLLFMRRP